MKKAACTIVKSTFFGACIGMCLDDNSCPDLVRSCFGLDTFFTSETVRDAFTEKHQNSGMSGLDSRQERFNLSINTGIAIGFWIGVLQAFFDILAKTPHDHHAESASVIVSPDPFVLRKLSDRGR